MQGITTRKAEVWRKRGNNWRKEGRPLPTGTPVLGTVGGDYFYLASDRRTKRVWIKIISVVDPPVIPPDPQPVGYRFAWDDEIPDFNFKCRSQMPEWNGVASPPAVLRFFPVMKEDAGDFRVNIESWKPFVLDLNDGDEQKFDYWTGPDRAQFNHTGWAQLAYLGMSGNFIKVLEFVDGWVKFETLKASEIPGWKMTDPCFIHSFHCVGFRDGKTVHIESTNTPRGEVLYPLVTKEGFAYIPARFVVKV